MPKQNIDIQTTIANIPAGIHIDYYVSVPPYRGNPLNCPSDLDYYGYTDIDYTVLDRKGYPAQWLERKLTPEDDERIKNEITNFINNPE